MAANLASQMRGFHRGRWPMAIVLLIRVASASPEWSVKLPVQGPSPTKQPPTRGQDSQDCGFTLLPDEMALITKTSGDFAVTGAWTTMDGATLVDWKQILFGWDHESTYFYVGWKLLFKAVVIPQNVEETLGMTFPDVVGDTVNTIAIRDCNDVLLYVFREWGAYSAHWEIFNHFGQFVAGSDRGRIYPSMMVFFDDKGNTIAYTQSPMITSDTSGATNDHPSENGDGHDIKEYQIRFVDGDGSTSSLTLSQTRWVITAVVQLRAIRDSTRMGDGQLRTPIGHNVFIVCLLAVCCIALALGVSIFVGAYRLVYPSKKTPIENPFLMHQHIVSSSKGCESYGAFG